MARCDYWRECAGSLKNDLLNCGCTEAEIRRMKYEDVREILEERMPESAFLFMEELTMRKTWAETVLHNLAGDVTPEEI